MYGMLLKYYFKQQWWARLSVEEIRRRQVKEFREVFEFARVHSPFYRKLYQEAGVGDLEILTYEDIEKVPVVDKAMMRAYAPEEIMTRPITSDLILTTTSGSTGEPFKIYQTKYEQYTSHIRVLGALMSLGYRPWHQILMLWRLEPDAVLQVEKDLALLTRLRRFFKLFRRDLHSIYSRPEDIVSWIQANPDAKVFWSTPGIMTILCDYLESLNITFRFDQTILTSETLSSEQRQRFAAYMGGQVVNHYGLAECPTIGFDTGIDGRKRIFTNAFMMELLNIEEIGGVLQGESVVTNLVNRTMPFIRYNTHDSAVKLDDPGCPTRIIGPVCGRVDDVLTLPGGEKLAFHQAYALFYDFNECMQYKFIQTRKGDIVLRLKKRPSVEEAVVRGKALERWSKRYPAEPLKVEFVETMPIDLKTGKFKSLERF